MLYRSLGRTEIKISAIGFGCWAAGNEWTHSSDEASIATIQRALEHGINFFDVAPVYGKGHAEEVLGRALGSKRTDVIIASKCGLQWDSDGVIRRNLSRSRILEEIDASLERLQTDYIDVYQIHWPDPNTPLAETLETLVELQHQGKIRHIAVTNFNVSLMEQTKEYTEIVSNQILYSMLDRNVDDYHGIPLAYRGQREILPYCRRHRISVIPYSPLAQGLLTGTLDMQTLDKDDVRWANPQLRGEKLEHNLGIVEKLAKLADLWGHPLVEVALNWLLYQREIGSIIAGASTPEQLDSNVKAIEWSLSPEQYQQLEAILDGAEQ